MLLIVGFFTKMKEHIGIILVTMSVLRPGDCGDCGTLTFDKLSYNVGSCASLIYKPENPNSDREWYGELKSLTRLNIASTSKYNESNQTIQFTLTINEIEEADAGSYIVSCAPGKYSDRAFLHVNRFSDAFHCGQLEFEQSYVYKGASASLIYKPDCAMASVEWYKTESQSIVRLHPNKTTEKSTKYTELKTDEGFILVISEIEFADVGSYFVSCGNGKFSRYAELNVKVDPESIDIKSQPTKENKTSNVECTTINGRPPSKPVFYLKNNLQSSIEITKTTQSGYTYNVTSTLWRKLTRQDNKASVRCCSESSPDVCSNTEYLNVTFPPKSVVLSELSKESKENGHTVLELKCKVDASNPKSFVDWKGVTGLQRKSLEEKYTNHTATHGWTYTTSLMFNLTKEDRRREITCHVKNFEFPDLKLQQSYTPHITYSPVITTSENGNKTVYIGDDVMISCHVDSNPPSRITWSSKGFKLEESYGNNKLDLHLINVTVEHSQTYICTASNGIGGTKSRDVTLTVKVELNPSEKSHNQPSNGVKSNTLVGAIIGGAVIISVTIVATVVFFICWKKGKDTSPKRVGTEQIKDEQSNETARPERKEPLYTNLLASNREEVQNATEYEFGDGTDHIDSEYERLQNQDDKRVYAELDLNFDSATGGIKLHNVIQPKTGTVKTDDDEVETETV